MEGTSVTWVKSRKNRVCWWNKGPVVEAGRKAAWLNQEESESRSRRDARPCKAKQGKEGTAEGPHRVKAGKGGTVGFAFLRHLCGYQVEVMRSHG